MSEPGRRASAVVLMMALLALIVGEGQARAEGIVVTGTTVMPTGDPMTIVSFGISLTPNTLFENGDFFTVQDVPDFVSATYGYELVTPTGTIDYNDYVSFTTSAGSADGLTDVTMTFVAATPPAVIDNTTGLDFAIGAIELTTSADFSPEGYAPLLKPYGYTSQADDPFGGTHTNGVIYTDVPTVVPEPASVALVGAGLTLGCLVARRRRRA